MTIIVHMKNMCLTVYRVATSRYEKVKAKIKEIALPYLARLFHSYLIDVSAATALIHFSELFTYTQSSVSNPFLSHY